MFAVDSVAHQFERLPLAGCRFGRPAVLRLLAIAFAVVTGLCLAPQVSQAEFIFATVQEGIDSRQSHEFASDFTPALVPRIEPTTPESTKPEPSCC